ncbi:PREDICTED: uncharacterized protein LOC109231448 [Nicotiana attenuata]|uniref:uncharacterized protein LOC109231448 n=1 Tax=Nicotiana attenuata TaxID=49451 RepID=UPI000904C347|nr:PREDICTED: uncharacterized protein LOC109231448 [Nicotiana attenuata]
MDRVGIRGIRTGFGRRRLGLSLGLRERTEERAAECGENELGIRPCVVLDPPVNEADGVVVGMVASFSKGSFVEDSVVSSVLVDNDSSANIYSLSTLQKLKIGIERIHINSVCVRGFDGGSKDSVDDIMLELSIGSVEFTMDFQVLDVAISYNLLLGRT